MTDKERLEGIIQSDILRAIDYGFDGHNVRREKILADVNWLIGQAERVEKLEREIESREYSHIDLYNREKDTRRQNKRYCEVLHLITNRISLDDEYIPVEVLFEIKKIVDEALEK